jgi:hypothetical protein
MRYTPCPCHSSRLLKHMNLTVCTGYHRKLGGFWEGYLDPYAEHRGVGLWYFYSLVQSQVKKAAPASTKWKQSKNFFINCPSEQENEPLLETCSFLHKIVEWWLCWTKSKICLKHCFVSVHAHK